MKRPCNRILIMLSLSKSAHSVSGAPLKVSSSRVMLERMSVRSSSLCDVTLAMTDMGIVKDLK